MKRADFNALILGPLLLIAACANEQDLGARDQKAPPGGYAAKAVEICKAAPNHHLNWDYDNAGKEVRDSTSCARRTECLDGPTLDPAVAAKALDCIEKDTDHDKPEACRDSTVTNASAARATVTDAENACTTKKSECGEGMNAVICDHAAVLTDAALSDYTACFDKPCESVAVCATALTVDAYECIDRLF